MALWLKVAREHGEPPPIETPQVLVEGLATKLAHREELGWDRLAEVHPCELTTRHE